VEDLVAIKNRIFQEILDNLPNVFVYRSNEYPIDGFPKIENSCCFRIGAKHKLTRSKKDFTQEELDDWPSCALYINNLSDIQMLGIVYNYKAFTDTNAIARILESTFSNLLAKYKLAAYIEPIFEKSEFWKIVETYPEEISKVKFELISPNLSNISGSLTIDLDQLKQDTNVHKTDVELNSQEDSHLSIKKTPFVEGLVDYSSEGGGNISVKIKGLKRRLSTKDHVKETILSEVDINSSNKDSIVDILRELIR